MEKMAYGLLDKLFLEQGDTVHCYITRVSILMPAPFQASIGEMLILVTENLSSAKQILL